MAALQLVTVVHKWPNVQTMNYVQVMADDVVVVDDEGAAMRTMKLLVPVMISQVYNYCGYYYCDCT